MLIKYLLNGKTLDLTSDIIKIQSENFSVDETGKVKATAGEIGGFITTTDEFSSNINAENDFSEEDLTKIMNYLMGTGTLTAEELIKYDVYKDGNIDARDYMMISNYIDTGISKSSPGKVTFSNGDVFNTFTIKDGTGTDLINLNAFESYIKELKSNSIATGRINAGNIQGGTVTVTPVANTPTSIDIMFDTEFDIIPNVNATAITAVPGTKVTGIGVSNITETGFTLWVTRNNNTDTIVNWTAIG